VKEISTGLAEPPRFERSLKLWHLVVYGIIIVLPTAPMGIYGMVSNIAHGHVATTILIAMFAMLLTAVSYGRMARVYPSAGPAFSYVSEELHPKAGYIVGWAMLMDYILNPVICVIWCSQAARNIVGVIALAGAFLLSYEQGAELLNFGAFIGVIGVNAATLVHYKYRRKEKVALPFLFQHSASSSASSSGFTSAIAPRSRHRLDKLGTTYRMAHAQNRDPRDRNPIAGQPRKLLVTFESSNTRLE